jgi:ribonuclease T1
MCWIIVGCALALGALAACARDEAAQNLPTIAAADLPSEARETLRRIERGGPYPYAKDGSVFFNREGLLPEAPRGYYREFTVRSREARGRGPRRIVKGARGELYYTEDHYRTFQRVTQ